MDPGVFGIQSRRFRTTVFDMSSILMVTVDVLLALGLALRATRFVTNDSLSRWYLRQPLVRWSHTEAFPNWDPDDPEFDYEPQTTRQRMVSGLYCPWCVGFWLAALVLLSLYLVGGPGHAAEWWRWVAGAFTLNYVVVHIGSPLKDWE